MAVDEMLWYYHSNETSWVELLHSTIYFLWFTTKKSGNIVVNFHFRHCRLATFKRKAGNNASVEMLFFVMMYYRTFSKKTKGRWSKINNRLGVSDYLKKGAWFSFCAFAKEINSICSLTWGSCVLNLLMIICLIRC